ncbi:SHC-transforming protein 1 isoform X1 [Rhagoletis pomonella]|uniref:SHC-transforming protein 1 isoform X1 n=1 Tax=Rhagoletis pomonella TaxID=28610 RepID=UPI001781D137|nr:SHC-transforming protein 1 isoform X1 [Rhagoletis pomonella]
MPRNGCEANGGVASDGCAYPDELIMEQGVSFNVRYTGCVEVKTSMKLLNFETRTKVARECINRVCEAAGLKSVGKRRVDKKILHFISDRPHMQNAGTNVIINVSSRALDLVNAETGQRIASHNMPHISFASGGDSDTLDFLAYIAKNEDEWRACYVLECIGGQSEDLILTIGKAFMLRFNAIKHLKNQAVLNLNTPVENSKDYYNDLPDKLPPDLLSENDLPPELQKQLLLQHQQQQQQQSRQSQLPQHKIGQLNLKKPRDRLSSNLIDLNSPPPDQSSANVNLSNFDPMADTEGACALPQAPVRDVFDMQPFSLSAEVQRSQLNTELWFHTGISRQISESMLKNDGDFLVRESQGKHGQYVLTGLEVKTPKHLLLIDPEGVVRTKDRIFDSISHLINYHWANSLPIISEDSELVLRNPVLRQAPGQKQQQQEQRQQHAVHSAAATSASSAAHHHHLPPQQQQQQQQHQHTHHARPVVNS